MCATAAATDRDITLGDRIITIPAPEGFTALLPSMEPYYTTIGAYVGPGNIRFATFVTTEAGEALAAGDESYELDRYVNVETETGISTASVSRAGFAELRETVRTQIEELYANTLVQLPELAAAGDKTVSEAFSADIEMEVGSVVPLPTHLDTDEMMAHSIYMTVGAALNGEDVGTDTLAATTLFLHVKDKVLFLYAYGAKSDLAWTREKTVEWARDIIAANPLNAEEQAAVDAPATSGIDWGRVSGRALIGGLAGLVIGLFSFLMNRRKKADG